MAKGGDVSKHALNMISLIKRLKSLDFSMDANLLIYLILQSLPNSFSKFIMNYHLNDLESALVKLLNKLVLLKQP